MRLLRLKYVALFLLTALAAPAWHQRELAGAGQVKQALDRLNVLGSVLIIGAHPDDENTALLACLARGRKARAAYLSLTRGEGGQNLIGAEKGDLLGVIRTQELLAARRIDGAGQFFTRAIDFGFSKSADETLDKWGHDAVLGDVVWVIRRFRPDVIVLRFSGSGRDGHGHHQAAGLLGQEAFAAAADKNRFPEQLQWTEPWQAKRLLWNVFGFTAQQEREAAALPARLEVDAGEYDPVLGYSYAEIAGQSRSMHRSQGMGAAERRGAAKQFFTHLAGEPAAKDLFDGIDTTWNRVPGGAEAGRLLAEAAQAFTPEHPERSVPALLRALPVLEASKHPWATAKLAELRETVALCAGLWLDAVSDRFSAVPGSSLTVRATALNRSQLEVELSGVSIGTPSSDAPAALAYNQPLVRELTWKVPAEAAYSQPFWLELPRQGELYRLRDQRLVGQAENDPALCARFRLRILKQAVEIVRPVRYRYLDRVEGEQTRPLIVAPAVTLRLADPALVFPEARPRRVEVVLQANAAAAGRVRLEIPAGWRSEPQALAFAFKEPGETTTLSFEVAPPVAPSRGQLRAVAETGNREIAAGGVFLSYPHIPPQAVFPESRAELAREDVRVLARNVGYVMGAGDEVPEILRQLGCQVTPLNSEDLSAGDLSRFDAIVTGVRAYNVRADLRASQPRLLDYVRRGGTLLVQYNVPESGVLANLGPYPFTVGRERVSVEEAPVTLPDPASPLLKSPNPIRASDFEGWVQERGLYFASAWDPRYRTLLESHDRGEPPRPGGTLYTRYGRGVYVFTAYAWFRQLPAGVPGALRLFANLLSAGKVLP